VTPDADTVPDDIDALRAALLAERTARHEAEARATGAEALIAHLKLLIAKLQRDRFGPTSERSRRLLDQFELQLEELEADAAEAEAKRPEPAVETRSGAARAKPVRGPLPAHLPRERVVIPGPTECPCCRGKLAKLGETVTETLEVIPRQWKVIQTVREKFTCRACETITQPPAPFHPIARGRAGPELLAMILEAKFGQHLPLNRQSETYAREDIHLDVSTMADWVGACTAALAPLMALIRAHVLGAARIHGDDTTVPVLARGKTITGRLWTYVRDDQPFGAAGGAVPLLPRPRRRASAPPPGRLCRDPAGRRVCRVQRSLQPWAKTRPDHRGGVLGARSAKVLRAGRRGQGADRARGGAPDRRHLRSRARHQRPIAGAAPGRPHRARQAAGGRAGDLDAPRAGPHVPA
jgi:transposase